MTTARVLTGLAVLLPMASLAFDAFLAYDVVPMTGRRSEVEILEWRQLRDPTDDPAEIYGHPAPGSARRVHVLPWSARAALEPVPELPGRRLFYVDEHPGVHLVGARRLHGPALGLGLLLGAAGFLLGRRVSRSAAPRT